MFKFVLQLCLFNYCACGLEETLLFMVQGHFQSYVFPYGTRWCILAQNTWHPRMCIRCTHKIVRYLVWISSFLWRLCKTLNINAEKFYSCTVVYFTLADLLGEQLSPRGEVQGLSFLHFDPFCFCLFWWKISRYFKAVGCFSKSRNTSSFLYTTPNCTEEQQYIILLWLTILENYSFQWQLSILVVKIPLL